MKLLIDTNIIVDVATMREPFFGGSDRILQICEQSSCSGYVSASTVADLFYIIRKVRGKDWTLLFLRRLVTFCQILAVDEAVIRQALTANFKDFEDAIQYKTAIAAGLEGIVTRNPIDYGDTQIPVYTPLQLLTIIDG